MCEVRAAEERAAEATRRADTMRQELEQSRRDVAAKRARIADLEREKKASERAALGAARAREEELHDKLEKEVAASRCSTLIQGSAGVSSWFLRNHPNACQIER